MLAQAGFFPPALDSPGASVRYDRYIRSERWRAKRVSFIAARGKRCERCKRGRRASLQVHHKTYERLGHERLEDVEVLCQRCHAEVHGKLAYAEPWQWAHLRSIVEEGRVREP